MIASRIAAVACAAAVLAATGASAQEAPAGSGLTLAETAALNYDYTQAGADSVLVAGTLTIQGANTVTVTPVGSELPPSRITLFTFGALAGGENLANWSVEAPGLKSYDITLNTTETSVYVRLRKIGTLVLLR